MMGTMTMGNLGGSFIIALPPSDIWLTDEQAAEFLSYEKSHFKASIMCLADFPKPRYVMQNPKGRRWNLKKLSEWLENRPDDTKNKIGRPRNKPSL